MGTCFKTEQFFNILLKQRAKNVEKNMQSLENKELIFLTKTSYNVLPFIELSHFL